MKSKRRRKQRKADSSLDGSRAEIARRKISRLRKPS
jgi:hypothetical protein